MADVQFLLIKRELCEHLDETFARMPKGVDPAVIEKMRAAGCSVCGPKGYVDSECDLADALRHLTKTNSVIRQICQSSIQQ